MRTGMIIGLGTLLLAQHAIAQQDAASETVRILTDTQTVDREISEAEAKLDQLRSTRAALTTAAATVAPQAAEAEEEKQGFLKRLTRGLGKSVSSQFDDVDVAVGQPKGRIFFDLGTDDANEVDLFHDGQLVPAVQLVELRFRNYFTDAGAERAYRSRGVRRLSEFILDNNIAAAKDAAGEVGKTASTAVPTQGSPEDKVADRISWGWSVGVGITAPAEDSEDGTQQASDAPVLLIGTGLFLQYDIDTGSGAEPALAIEAGYTVGFSTDESFGDSSDDALYVGVGLHFEF